MSLNSFNPLARAYDAPFGEPRTVGDVVDLYARRQLREIRGLGPRRLSEIEAALVLAGLNLAGHQQLPRAGRTTTRPGAPPEAQPPENWPRARLSPALRAAPLLACSRQVYRVIP